MTYVMSDIHGRYDKYIGMLEKIKFSSNDTLYVLGDVLDRGSDGFKNLLDMASRSNVTVLLGNHEVMAIQALPHLLREASLDEADLTDDDIELIKLWFSNGGEASFEDFLSLDVKQAETVWKYMLSMPLYREIEVNGRDFLLLHGGLGNFSQERALNDYTMDEIVWYRPEVNTVYYPNKTVIHGHTPTRKLYEQAGKPNITTKVFHAETFIDIDCGCAYYDGKLGCLCLETMEEFYV